MSGYTTATVAVVGLISTAVGTVSSVMQAQQQAKAQQAQAEYNAAIAEKNQELADEQARQSRQKGYQEMIKKRQETAMLISKQRAQAGASGAQVGQGSFLDLELDTAEKGEMDALAAYQAGLNGAYNAEINAWNYGQQKEGYQTAADNAASNAGMNAFFAGANTAIGGLTQVGAGIGKWKGQVPNNKG